jgi:2-oxoglutarate ferredoxin oxidoreductase subunit alpha
MPPPAVIERESIALRLAGDSGDGIQLAGAQLAHTSALCGNAVSTLPDFPGEIRAPAGSLAGVSGFQIHFGGGDVLTPGDRLDALVAMNPAALKSNLSDLASDGVLVVNADAFQPDDLAKAGYVADPLTDGSLHGYRLLSVPLAALNQAALANLKLSAREADRCKNFFALGLLYWIFERPLEHTSRWIKAKFDANPAVREANGRALRAGYHFGELLPDAPRYRVASAAVAPGCYRKVTGHEATAMALIAAAKTAGLSLLYAGCPGTPTSDLLHELAGQTRFGVRVFQAEDEAAAMGAAVGAAFGGGVGVTASSGPGLDLKADALGLAVAAELPVVVIDVQRGGPSTGLPTKTEQADLLQALFGRHGECPAAVLAACSPADCFDAVYEAVRVAVAHMTPVIVLSDGAIANGAEPWRLPAPSSLPPIRVNRPATANGVPFRPYQRDDRLVRPWAAPGTPGLEHRVGGLEKTDGTGEVDFDPLNHERMVSLRSQKVARIADDLPEWTADGPTAGDLLLVGWGGTFGALRIAARRARRRGLSVAHAHLRWLNPMPRNAGDLLRRYRTILVAELNAGQLQLLLRAAYLLDVAALNKVHGRPFQVGEIEAKIDQLLG